MLEHGQEGCLWKICLKPGHIVSKCCTPPMCKKYNKYHLTQLHMEADPKTEGTKRVKKDLFYVAPSKWNEEVLLMTCPVEVMAPEGSVMQAKTLLDCAGSTSFIIQCLAKKLCLPWCHSNFEINGVAGFNISPKGTVCIKVAGVRGGRESDWGGSLHVSQSNRRPTHSSRFPIYRVTLEHHQRWRHASAGY